MRKLVHFEGLRGVSAFIVFIAHFRPAFCPFIDSDFLNYMGITGIRERILADNFIGLFYEGTLPVFIFWFMSAYVISIKLFDLIRNENNIYLTEAVTKRYFRLSIPVFFSSLLCFILMKAHLIFNTELSQQFNVSKEISWVYNQFRFEPGIIHFLKTTIVEVFLPGNCNYNFALWTMNPELLGSFLCFGMFAVVGRNKNRFPIYLFTLAFLILGGVRDHSYSYYITFVAGIMWCDAMNSTDEGIYLKERIRKLFNSAPFTLLLLLFSFAVPVYSEMFHQLPENVYYMVNYSFKAIAITLMVNNFSFIKRFFSIKPFQFLGRISFSLYLLHLPILLSLGAYLYLYAGIDPAYKTELVFIIMTIVMVLISWIFTRLVDDKAVKISDKIGKYFSR